MDNGRVSFDDTTISQSRFEERGMADSYGPRSENRSFGLIDENGSVMSREDQYGRNNQTDGPTRIVKAKRDINGVEFSLMKKQENGEPIYESEKLTNEEYNSLFTERRVNELGYDEGFISGMKYNKKNN